jgi:hypothetical protein
MLMLALLAACGDAVTTSGPIAVGPTRQEVRAAWIPPALGGPKDPVPTAPLGPAQCTGLTTGGATRDGCVTADVACGETVIGHTRGGARVFDSAFYERAFCTPRTSDHDGGDERVYRLRVPDGDRRVVVTLDTPCADLDVAAVLWGDDGCPAPGASIPRCEMFPSDGTARETLELVTQHATTWLLVVEGKDAEEGAFGLSVQCFDGLH